MSIEYMVHVHPVSDECRNRVFDGIKQSFPTFQSASDGNGLWLPSANPKWIDFSIEESEGGFLIVSNVSSDFAKGIFSILREIFDNLKLNYSIEEV